MSQPNDYRIQDSIVEYLVQNWESRQIWSCVHSKLKLTDSRRLSPCIIELLVKAFVKHNMFTESLFCHLVPFVQTSLDLTGCNFLKNVSLRQISFHCRNLSILILDGCKQLRNGVLLAIIQNCTKLETLSLVGCQEITDRPFETSSYPFHVPMVLLSLKSLTLSWVTQLEGTFATSLAKCSELKSLSLAHCRRMQKDALIKLFSSLNLQFLDVSHVPAVDDEVLLQLSSNCKNLKVFKLEKCHVRDESLIRVCTNSPHLEVLCVGANSLISDSLLEHLSIHNKCLQVLDLSNCARLTNAGMSLVLSCLHVSSLNVSFCTLISDGAFDVPVGCLNSLVEIDLSFCQISDVTIPLLSQCEKLKHANLVGCGISRQLSQRLASNEVFKFGVAN